MDWPGLDICLVEESGEIKRPQEFPQRHETPPSATKDLQKGQKQAQTTTPRCVPVPQQKAGQGDQGVSVLGSVFSFQAAKLTVLWPWPYAFLASSAFLHPATVRGSPCCVAPSSASLAAAIGCCIAHCFSVSEASAAVAVGHWLA